MTVGKDQELNVGRDIPEEIEDEGSEWPQIFAVFSGKV